MRYHIKITKISSLKHEANNKALTYLLLYGLLNMIFLLWYSVYQIIPGSTMSVLICYFYGIGSSLSYNIFKFFIYFLLFFRVYESYKGGIMAYKNLFFGASGTILILYAILSVASIFVVHATVDSSGACQYNYSILYAASIILMDMLAIIASSYLFIKPIFNLKKFNQELKLLIIKHLFLSSIANFSTIFFVLIAILQGILIGYIVVAEVNGCFDIVISSISVLAMFPEYEHLVDNKILKCCKCLLTGPNSRTVPWESGT